MPKIASAKSSKQPGASRRPLTKHGKPAVVIVDAGEYDRLRKLQHLKAPSFAEMLLAMPQGEVEFQRLDTTPRDVEF